MNDNQPLTDLPPIDTAQVAEFIQRWQNASGSERANYRLYLTDLCSLLGLPQPKLPMGLNANPSNR